MDVMQAADVADAFLVDQGAGQRVVRDLADTWADDEVFVFTRTPLSVDDTLLVVDRTTGVARFVSALPWEPHPFPMLSPVDDVPEDALS